MHLQLRSRRSGIIIISRYTCKGNTTKYQQFAFDRSTNYSKQNEKGEVAQDGYSQDLFYPISSRILRQQYHFLFSLHVLFHLQFQLQKLYQNRFNQGKTKHLTFVQQKPIINVTYHNQVFVISVPQSSLNNAHFIPLTKQV